MDQTLSDLKIEDIANAVRIIDFAADNGAFRGTDNMRQVIVVRDRLDAFVTAATAAAANSSAPADDHQQ